MARSPLPAPRAPPLRHPRRFGPALTVPRTSLLPTPAFLPPHRSLHSLQPRSSSSASSPQLPPLPGPGSLLPAPPSSPTLQIHLLLLPLPSVPIVSLDWPPVPEPCWGLGVWLSPWCQPHCAPQHPLSMQHPGPLGAPTPHCCPPHPGSSLRKIPSFPAGFSQNPPQPAGGRCHSPAPWQSLMCHAPSRHRVPSG